LPLSVEVRTPVSETGRAGALPAAAAIFIFDLQLPICDLRFENKTTKDKHLGGVTGDLLNKLNRENGGRFNSFNDLTYLTNI
jgi:hypothetical protein